jgi:Dyp-type peroxidase family
VQNSTEGVPVAILADSPLTRPQDIQGNVLLPFGGRYQAFLALSFSSDRSGARRWLSAAAGRVAGTDDVEAALDGDDEGQGRARRGRRIKESETLLNIGLTATGVVLLHHEAAADLAGFEAFWRGPLGVRLDDANRVTTAPALLGDVGDSDPARWVVGKPDGPAVDALLTLAADNDRQLAAAMLAERDKAEAAGLAVLWEERGEVLRNADERRVEHFGFADGISQPGIRGFSDPAKAKPLIAAGEFVLGCPGERRPQTWAPRPSAAPWMRGGSFQVFRRLSQDAAGWWKHMASQGGDPEDAAAHALGRRLDGTPLSATAKSGGPNDFTYEGDDSGARTALYAHIRKMNPREDEVFRDRGHKMLRRGIPFGPKFDRAQPDDRPRGILFNAYMASIEDQFEFVHRRWANDPEFPASTLAKYGRDIGGAQRVDGLDPVVGLGEKAARERFPQAVAQKIPGRSFGGFVTTTGAVYAFAPSLPALRRLAGEEALD